MNERIKQLVAEAWKQRELITESRSLDEAFTSKFAELIVRECANWVNNNLGLVDEEARADLLKHFGVEE
jgi:hypothetical protein